MSIKLMSEAWGTSGLTASQKLVLIAFCDYANDDGECWPSHKKMAEKCDMSERNLQKHIQNLEELGLITSAATYRSNGSQGNNFFNVMAPVKNDTPPLSKMTPPPVKNDTPYNHHNNHQKNKNIIPPLLSEVIAYCQERRNGVDPDKWFNFYQAKGWMVGKNKMKDWRAAVRTWEPKVTIGQEDYIR